MQSGLSKKQEEVAARRIQHLLRVCMLNRKLRAASLEIETLKESETQSSAALKSAEAANKESQVRITEQAAELDAKNSEIVGLADKL